MLQRIDRVAARAAAVRQRQRIVNHDPANCRYEVFIAQRIGQSDERVCANPRPSTQAPMTVSVVSGAAPKPGRAKQLG
jgi:hypothetical protein